MLDRRVQILEQTGLLPPLVTLSALRDVPHLVLLGEPGIGKTTVLKAEARSAGTHIIQVRELINETVDVPTGTLFLDALDEYRMGATDLGKVDELVKAIRRLGTERWRLTCRAEDWKKAADVSAVRRSTNDRGVTVAQLLPLNVTEQLVVLHALGVTDPNAFVDRAHAMGAAGLLESPLSLKLLNRSVIGGGPWPTSRFALFSQATSALAHEENETHRLDRTRASADAILDAAAFMSLLLLVSGGRSIWRSNALPPDGDVRAFLQASACGLAPALVDDVLGSSLFRGEGEAFEPVHRTIAEFLGARALARAVRGGPSTAALPIGRAEALITGSDRRPPTDLRGLYAWFAAHLATLGETADAHRLIEADAVSVLVYGDAAVFDGTAKRAMLASLDKHDPYFRASEVGVTAVGGLAGEELADDLRVALENPDGTHRMMTVFEVLTAGRPVLSLQPLLRGIALNPERPEWQRNRAMSAWLNGGPDASAGRRELFDALANEPSSAVRESMRAELLSGLPADQVTLADIRSVIAAFAAAPGDSTVMRLFGLRIAIESAPRPDLFDAPFDWLPTEGDRRHSIDVDNFIDHALAAAIMATTGLTAERLWLWLTNAREDRLTGLGDATRPAITAWLDAAPGRDLELFEAVLDTDDPDEGPWMIGTYFAMVAGQPTGAMLDRLTDRSASSAGRQRARLLSIAVDVGRRYPVGERAYWRLHNYLSSMRRGGRRLLAALSSMEIERWRRSQAKATSRMVRIGASEREGNLRTLRRLARSMSVGGNTHALAWAAMLYFQPQDQSGGEQTPLERLAAATDATVLDAVLSGWRHHATHDQNGVTPSTLGEIEAGGMHFHSEYASIAGLHRLLSEAIPVAPAELPLTLAIIVLRSAWIARSTDAVEALEAWAWTRLNVDPDAGAEALLAYWEAILMGGGTSSSTWHGLGKAVGGNAERLALAMMIERHPDMPATVLRPVIAAAATRVGRDVIGRLSIAALTNPLVEAKSKAIWTLVTFTMAPLDQRRSLKGYEGDLLDLFDGFSGSEFLDTLGSGGPPEQIAIACEVFQLIAPHAEPSVERRRGRVTQAHRLSDVGNAMLKRLAEQAVPAASKAIARLRQDVGNYPAWDAAVRHAAEQQARALRDREHVPPTPAEIVQLVAGHAPVNAADLRAIMVHELRRFGRELRTGPNTPWRDFWNTNKYEKVTEPKVENVARDITLNRLQDRLAKYRIAAVAGEARRADGTRVDILLTSGAGRNLPIEAKRHYHPDVWNAASTQLQGYAADEGAEGEGILLVFWYGDDPPAPKRVDGRVPVSAAEMERMLADDLPSDLRQVTEIVVLDVSAPDAFIAKPIKPTASKGGNPGKPGKPGKRRAAAVVTQSAPRRTKALPPKT